LLLPCLIEQKNAVAGRLLKGVLVTIIAADCRQVVLQTELALL